MVDHEEEINLPLGYDLSIKPTDEKLKRDAAKLCAEYIQYWLPGEVEVTVILARSDSKEPTYATSVLGRERLRALLRAVADDSAIQTLMVRANRWQR
jgi:hypothetical protein